MMDGSIVKAARTVRRCRCRPPSRVPQPSPGLPPGPRQPRPPRTAGAPTPGRRSIFRERAAVIRVTRRVRYRAVDPGRVPAAQHLVQPVRRRADSTSLARYSSRIRNARSRSSATRGGTCPYPAPRNVGPSPRRPSHRKPGWPGWRAIAADHRPRVADVPQDLQVVQPCPGGPAQWRNSDQRRPGTGSGRPAPQRHAAQRPGCVSADRAARSRASRSATSAVVSSAGGLPPGGFGDTANGVPWGEHRAHLGGPLECFRSPGLRPSRPRWPAIQCTRRTTR